jgi:hypothetical protein
VRTVKPFLLMTAAALLVLGALFALWPQQSWLLLMRALAPHREFETLQASALQVKPGDVMRLPARHAAALRGCGTRTARTACRDPFPAARRTQGRGAHETRCRHPAPNPVAFELELPSVEEGFEYRVRYGNAWTRPTRSWWSQSPACARRGWRIPSPLHRTARHADRGVVQEIAAVAGTRVRIEAAFDRACAASLAVNDLALPNPGGAATNAVWLQTLTTTARGAGRSRCVTRMASPTVRHGPPIRRGRTGRLKSRWNALRRHV